MGVDEVGKLGVGNGFIRKLSESGEVGTELLELAIKVGGGCKELMARSEEWRGEQRSG
jgi:hypothetical protein